MSSDKRVEIRDNEGKTAHVRIEHPDGSSDTYEKDDRTLVNLVAPLAPGDMTLGDKVAHQDSGGSGWEKKGK